METCPSRAGRRASFRQTVAASLGAGLMSDRRHQLRRRIIHSTLANETIAEEGDGGGDGLMAPEFSTQPSQPHGLSNPGVVANSGRWLDTMMLADLVLIAVLVAVVVFAGLSQSPGAGSSAVTEEPRRGVLCRGIQGNREKADPSAKRQPIRWQNALNGTCDFWAVNSQKRAPAEADTLWAIIRNFPPTASQWVRPRR